MSSFGRRFDDAQRLRELRFVFLGYWVPGIVVVPLVLLIQIAVAIDSGLVYGGFISQLQSVNCSPAGRQAGRQASRGL